MSPGYNTLPEWEKPKTGALPYVELMTKQS